MAQITCAQDETSAVEEFQAMFQVGRCCTKVAKGWTDFGKPEEGQTSVGVGGDQAS